MLAKRSPLLITLLVVASTVGGIYAKTYDINLTTPTTVGDTQLPPGDYRLDVKDGMATLTNARTRKNVKVPVKVTNVNEKFKNTIIDTNTTVNPPQLRFIGLAGSTVQVEFEK